MRRAAVFIFMLMGTVVFAGEKSHVDADLVTRVKQVRTLIGDVDQRPAAEVVHEIKKSKYPQIQLAMLEAMARTYAEIVEQQGVEGKAKKEWLFSMIKLNMAYLQFQGKHIGKADALNTLIRHKLTYHLPEGIYKHPGFHVSIS